MNEHMPDAKRCRNEDGPSAAPLESSCDPGHTPEELDGRPRMTPSCNGESATGPHDATVRPDVLRAYAADIRKYGKPLDSGLPGVLERAARQIETRASCWVCGVRVNGFALRCPKCTADASYNQGWMACRRKMIEEFGEACRSGCDPDGAWDCAKEGTAEPDIANNVLSVSGERKGGSNP